MLLAAKALALTALDLVDDPAFLATVRQEFEVGTSHRGERV
jgi:hypothetical protein